MDSAKKLGAKKDRGNLMEDARTQNSEKDPVTKIKTSDLRKPDKKADRQQQKDRLEQQGRR